MGSDENLGSNRNEMTVFLAWRFIYHHDSFSIPIIATVIIFLHHRHRLSHSRSHRHSPTVIVIAQNHESVLIPPRTSFFGPHSSYLCSHVYFFCSHAYPLSIPSIPLTWPSLTASQRGSNSVPRVPGTPSLNVFQPRPSFSSSRSSHHAVPVHR